MEHIFRNRTSVVSLGQAPDGLPLQLFIDRGPSASEFLEPIARRLGFAGASHRGTPLEPVVNQLEDLFRRNQSRPIQAGERMLECYISGQPIRSILGETLLERIIASADTVIHSGARTDTRAVPPPPIGPAAMNPPTAGARPVRADIGTGHLAIPLNGAGPIVVRRIEDPLKGPVYRYDHAYEPESFRMLATARFEMHLPSAGEHFAAPMSDAQAYLDARLRARSTGMAALAECQVDRAEVVRMLAGISRQIEILHRRGEVHGDVKPANTLIAKSGARVIDSLQLRPGQASPAMTPGWAAPEQVTGEPVSFSTDQYPLGVMLCRLLKAVMYGEEIAYLIPAGHGRLERFTTLRNPGGYIDPAEGAVTADGVQPWRNVIDRCLRFRPDHRFGSMGEAADAIEEAAASHPPRGTCSLNLAFGQLLYSPEPVWQRNEIRPIQAAAGGFAGERT